MCSAGVLWRVLRTTVIQEISSLIKRLVGKKGFMYF